MSSKKAENPNAFKLAINKDLMARMAKSIQSHHSEFDSKKFVAAARGLNSLELKQRVQYVRDLLKSFLPSDYEDAVRILLASLNGNSLRGFDLWPYTEFVQTYGLHKPKVSLDALYELTQIFTSEFAVRPFLKNHPDLTLKFLAKCAQDKSHHVRRWVSEGTRPRLPWGEKLFDFIKDPTANILLLEKLKYDDELYVRKSIANHLNDIAKDNPKVVIATLKKWQKSVPEKHKEKLMWITQQALRTLIKSGDSEALELVGVSSNVSASIENLKLNQKNFKLGDRMAFEFKIKLKSNKPEKLIIDYIIHHVKANKQTSPKVFKLKIVTLKPGASLQIKKQHHIKPITTRKYYSGQHKIEIQVNGKICAQSDWNLKV